MRLLFFVDNFPPETNAPATRCHAHCKHWVKSGHTVTVITSNPNFPEGVLHEGFKNSWRSVEYIDGIRVVRVKTFITKNTGFFLRIMDFLSFMLVSFIMAWFEPRPQKVIASSPQFFSLVSAGLYAWLNRCEFIMEIRDFWPGSVQELTNIPGFLLSPIYTIEHFLYRKAHKIVVVTKGFKDTLLDKHSIDPDKIYVIPNGVELSTFAKRTDRIAELKLRHDLTNKFVVGYIGTHGIAQDLSRLLKTARSLIRHGDIIFLFVGTGSEREFLLQESQRMNLTNVIFVKNVPKTDVPNYLGLMNLSYVGLRNIEFFSNVIPSKIFECLAVGVPVLASLPKGDATNIIQSSDSGIVSDINDENAMRADILFATQNRQRLKQFSENGRANVHQYSREILAQEYLEILEN